MKHGVRTVPCGVSSNPARAPPSVASTAKGKSGRPSTEAGLEGSTDIFITPGHRFEAVDVLLTNLHLPRSSVLALTMAFAGVQRLRDAYEEAVELEYRFFSFGDAMLAERPLMEAPRARR